MDDEGSWIKSFELGHNDEPDFDNLSAIDNWDSISQGLGCILDSMFGL